MAVSVNGKLRATINVEKDMDKDEVLDIARSNENVQRHLENKEIVKEIFVPNKIVNFVVK